MIDYEHDFYNCAVLLTIVVADLNLKKQYIFKVIEIYSIYLQIHTMYLT
jgi:hypothetical protein